MGRKVHEASEAVRTEWLRRVEAEYHSGAVFQHLTLWLTQLAVSPDLVHGGLRVAADEMDHADLSRRVYAAAGGTEMARIPREVLHIARDGNDPLEHDVVRAAVYNSCLGETLAVPLFRAMRAACVVPVAARAIDRILEDEVRHGAFGFALLDWFLASPVGAELRALVQDELPVLFARLRSAYGAAGEEEDAMSAEDRAWGLMPPRDYAAVVERTIRRTWIPRFSKRGIDAALAWEVSERHLQRTAEKARETSSTRSPP